MNTECMKYIYIFVYISYKPTRTYHQHSYSFRVLAEIILKATVYFVYCTRSN